MKMIPLTKGYISVVDDEDYEMLMKYKWYALVGKNNRHVYAKGSVNGKVIPMHRLIMGVRDPAVKVDHIDHITLNNQRNNLRLATQSQNACNRRVGFGTSKYVGVSFHKRSGKWHSAVYIDKKYKNVGFYDNEIEAAKARDAAAIKAYGEFAKLNF